MEIGVVSDIHANLPAFESVLEQLRERAVADIICAGDIVGYYGSPNEVVKMFKKNSIKAVRGNHDDAVLNGTPQDLQDSARFTVNWTRKAISREAKSYLRSLPITRTDKVEDTTIYVAHGSPRSPLTDYIYEDDIDPGYIDKNFAYSPDIVVHGHTHLSYVTEVGQTTFVNPGSVGQPRDGEPSASYAIIDTKYGTAARYRTEYDISKTIETLEKNGLPSDLGRRLLEGK